MKSLRHGDKFRSYQREAINMARRYRNAFPSMPNPSDASSGAALVYHPTGTGKTVVMAGLAHASPEIGNVLVLTTREAVRDQLARELAGNLFIDSEKFNLSKNIRLAKAAYVANEGKMLEGRTVDLHEATCKLFTGNLLDFANAQFSRMVQRPNDAFLRELSRNQTVLIMTVQMLVSLRRDNRSIYESLKKHIDLVLFDEGHYEPAIKYSDAVRSLQRPTVLMSATPFRNDLKPFKVKAENIHIYKFAAAISDGVIRDVAVVPRSSTRDPNVFCLDIVAYCEREFGSDRAAWPRVIIHCDDAGSIERLGEAFIAHGFKDQVVGIHDQFHAGRSGHQGWQHRSVPPPRHTKALIWIHQYKLMEGIDDYRFRVLAFFDLLKNVRSVVQQIGRVIRIAPGESGIAAFVLDHYQGRVAQYWNLYKAYDESTSADYLTKTLSKFYLEKFTEVQPPIDYIQRKFRGLLNMKSLAAPEDEILFDRRATFKVIESTSKVEDFVDLVETELAIEDYEFQTFKLDRKTALFVVAKVESPDFLNTRYFAEARHGAVLLLLLPSHGLLAISTVGAAPEGLSHLQPIAPDKLDRVLAPGQLGRISGVTSRNTNLGNRVVRRRTISAPSIADVPPILDEYGHVITTVIGYNGTTPRVQDDLDYQEVIDEDFNIVTSLTPTAALSNPDLLRRYIGITSGRISEQGAPIRLKAFREWVDSLAKQMASGPRYATVYDRFAAVSPHRITEGGAKNLLLDIFDLAEQYKHKDTNEILRGDDLCVDRTSLVRSAGKPSSKFDVIINDRAYQVDIIFDPVAQRYRFESPELDKTFVRTDGRTKGLARVINETQSFNVIPDDKGVIYVHGRFFAPGLKFGKRFSEAEFFAGHCLYPSAIFKHISSEKGARVLVRADKFDPSSLFSAIDGWKDGFDTNDLQLSQNWIARYQPERVAFTPSLCICDDTHKESADFIVADKKHRRVVLIHAKASKKFREFSASAVQEVCAQAQKNTALFSTFSLQRPGNYSLWDRPHKFTGDDKASLTIRRRIRKPVLANFKAKDAWEELAALLYNPLTNREVWLVLGSMLSADTFYRGLRSEDPAAETLQLNHLLQTTIAAAASVGAKTRIFCAP